ncbi:ATP-binding protein [Emcibacter sp. SYSU 3D8]|uniref:hybrid sensor histidine kinase/response regulator n=1 Tax=Emcibacter sp. SYSU 3D8 TaxID=3133969 RepID=UPI0031FE8B4F
MTDMPAGLILKGMVASPSAFVVLDARFRVVFANDTALRIWGLKDRGEVVGKRAAKFWEDMEGSQAFVARLVQEKTYSGELVARRTDGAPVDLYVSANTVEDEHGKLLGILGVFFDISIQRDELRRLEAGREVFAFVSKHAKMVVWEAIPEAGHFRILGGEPLFSRGSSDGAIFSVQQGLEIYGAEDRQRLAVAATAVMEGQKNVQPVQALAMLPDGTRRWVETDVFLVSAPGEKPARLLGWSLDITDRKQAESRAQQAQRIQTLGQMAGGVAHDFNNLLMGLQMNLELLRSRTAGDMESEEFVKASMRTVERGAELTRYLLAFSRDQALQSESVDVGATVMEMTGMLQRTLGDAITIRTTQADGLRPALADRSQLENAMLNLAINARDAMPDHGELLIDVRNVTLNARDAGDGSAVAAGNYVMLSMTDTGRGMPPEVSERAFEPFFTTKESGKGSGLGLSMVYGLVKQLGGHVELESAEGAGTTVRLYFPPAETAVVEKARVDPSTALPRGSETILVVEDEPTVRRSLVKVLTNLGYEVYSAGDGPDALRLIDEFQIHPNLVLSDVSLPRGMSGPDVVMAVMGRVQGCRALLMSGYAEGQQSALDRLEAGLVDLLAKPYTRDVLANKIRDVLDA